MAKQLIRNVFPVPGGLKLIYCTQEGRYIGDLIVNGINSAALRAIAEDFRDFTIEEAAALEAQPSPEIEQAVSRIVRQ
jgi:hypothetical protein